MPYPFVQTCGQFLRSVIVASVFVTIQPVHSLARELRAADSQSLDYPAVQAILYLDHYIRDRTDNRLSIKVFPSALLGGDEETISQTRSGVIDMTRVNVSSLAGIVPQLDIFNAPHLFQSREHLLRVLDGPLGEELLHLAEREQAPALLVEAHFALGETLFYLGEVMAARRHCEQSVARYNAQQHRFLAIEYGHDPAMSALGVGAWALWALGYPEQAVRQSQASVTHAHGLTHPFSLAYALTVAIAVHQHRREWNQAQEQAEAVIALANEQGFPYFVAHCTIYRGRTLAEHGHATDGIAQMRWGIAAMRDTGSEIYQSYFPALLAEAYLKDGQVEEGLATVAEALAFVDRTEERFYEAELWRIKGQLLLAQESREQGAKSTEQETENPKPNSQILDPQSESEACFLKAIEIAQKQQAKSLELRAVMSLARLWQQQGKHHEAHQMLAEIYDWFTEGFDTKDLQEARALLEGIRANADEDSCGREKT